MTDPDQPILDLLSSHGLVLTPRRVLTILESNGLVIVPLSLLQSARTILEQADTNALDAL